MKVETLIKPIFSVVIPTFNRLNLLKRAVTSVINQSYQSWELIVIDDGSVDGTETWLSEIQDSRVRWFTQENEGVSSARNRGIKTASAQWIAFLDSDDWWLEKKLETVLEAMKQDAKVRVWHTRERWFRNGQMHNPKIKHANPDGWSLLALVERCCVSMSTLVVHKDVIDCVGMFNEEFPVCEDQEWLLRISRKYPLSLIDQVLTEKEGGRSDQLSASNGLDRWRFEALINILKSGDLSEEVYHTVFCTAEKKAKIFLNGCIKRGKTHHVQYIKQILDCYKPDGYNTNYV